MNTLSTVARILIVDDLPQNVKLLTDPLKARGYTVIAAASGPEAASSEITGTRNSITRSEP